MAPAPTGQHSHRSKVQDLSHRKSPHQQLMSKFDRRNQARQKQNTKHKEHQRDLNVFQGRDGAPRIVALVPLCDDANAAAAVRSLTGSLDVDIDVPEEGIVRADIDRFKQKVQYIITKKELFSCMNASRVADFVVFILSPEQEVDELGELIIRSVESQGLSTTLTVVQGLDKIEPPKRRPGILSSLKSYVQHFHPDQEKVHNLDSRQECANLMRSLCTLAPKGIRWREERSWIGKGLKADRLISVGDWGDFQIEKITAAPLASKKRRTDEMATDDSNDETVLETPGEDQDDLAELAPEGIMMEDDDDAAMSVAQQRSATHLPAAPKRLPKGTSNYQSAWFLGDHFSDSGSDMEDFDDEEMTMDTPALPQDGAEGLAPREPTEAAPSEYPQSEMFLDPNPDDEAEAEQLAAFRRRKTDEAAEDREFPDEIELHPNVLAPEDRAYEPEDWRRLLQVPDYKSSRSQVTREALVGGVAAGTRVHVHLRNVPSSLQSTYNASQPLSAFSLLRHEHKKAVLNINFTLSSDYPSPIKSKSEMIVQCGPRRFVVNPLFSQGGNTPNDVHKFDRFLHPGQSTVASFIGPLSWGSIPALFFQRPSESAPSSAPLLLIGTGTSLPPSTSRIIAKRIILTGHPYKIHKRLVTVRYMFFNREDVEWFKALQLWTKRGRSGFIKESLGTHGYFKATFDGKINPQDAVGVSLYKRMWPRNARSWDPVSDGLSEDMAGDRDVAME
ncbi:AARP2CN domain-containing protein [Botrytis cinerea]